MSYCTAQDVLVGPLQGIDLTQIGEASVVMAHIESILDATKLIVDSEAGRDFDLHEDEVITIDGTDSNKVILWKNDLTLCVPVVEVTAVSVYGAALDIDTLKFDPVTGILGYQRGFNERVAIRRSQRGTPFAFPKDFKNVEVTLTWGYEEVPADVIYAQALVTATSTLLTLVGGINMGARELRINDYEVVYGTAPFSAQVKGWAASLLSIMKKYRTGRRYIV